MKKFFIAVALIVTTITGLFAEKKWNIGYRIRQVTPDEFYTNIFVNPHWQECEMWIDEDNDTFVDYMDPYWDNDVVKTTMERISQERKSTIKESRDDKVYAFIEISYEDSGVDSADTLRTFIRDLDTYVVREFFF